jgi:3-deoxy-D-arabino-heptulosonate 7-phosphate (DAHP) synthase
MHVKKLELKKLKNKIKRWKTRKKWETGWMNLTHPLVIAGPCSAETEDQVLKSHMS